MQGKNQQCNNIEFSDDFLAKAKTATVNALQGKGEEDHEDPLDDVSGQVLRILNGEMAK